MLESLLPPEISVVAVYGDDLDAVLLPAETALMEGAVAARRAEFATARQCARRALTQIGASAGPILRGPKREPLWPAGVVGSITHCTGYRAAAVARASAMLAIGIDAEPHAAIPLRVAQRVLVEEEREWAAREEGRSPSGVRWDRLIFSAKESVYKAWFPLARRWLGFDEAVITIDPAARTFRARLLIDPPASLPAEFHGRFAIENGLVLTAIAVPRR